MAYTVVDAMRVENSVSGSQRYPHPSCIENCLIRIQTEVVFDLLIVESRCTEGG
jgi:hypothetical protein